MKKTRRDSLINDHRLPGKSCSKPHCTSAKTKAPRFINAGNSFAEYGIELKMRRRFSPVSALRCKHFAE